MKKNKKENRLFLAKRAHDVMFVSRTDLSNTNELCKEARQWFSEMDDDIVVVSNITKEEEIPEYWRDGAIFGTDDDEPLITPSEFLEQKNKKDLLDALKTETDDSIRFNLLKRKLDCEDFREFLSLQRKIMT